MNKIVLPIKGMHCRSCEILIEERLREIPDIKNVSVSYKRSEAVVYSKKQIDFSVLQGAVEEAGYAIGKNDPKAWISKEPKDYRDTLVSLIILFGLYLIGNKFGLFNISTGGSGNPSNLTIVLLVGLTAGLSTCMALVGGLVLGIAARHAEKHPEASPLQKFRPHIFFNLGRIASYFILGGLIGLIGKAFQLTGPTLGVMTIVVGVFMLVLGLQLTELFPRLSSGGLTLPAGIAKLFGLKQKHTQEYSHANSVVTGALTFFLPCGFTQAMQLYAMSTGNFWSGAAIMGIFAIGTAPGLLGIGGLVSVVKGRFATLFYKTVGLVVISLAIININSGLTLGGFRHVWQNLQAPKQADNAKTDSNPIVLNTTFLSAKDDISPNTFTAEVGKPVIFRVEANADGVGCMSTIMIPGLADRPVVIKKGKTIEFNFTPKNRGTYDIACAMGVKRGEITVR